MVEAVVQGHHIGTPFLMVVYQPRMPGSGRMSHFTLPAGVMALPTEEYFFCSLVLRSFAL